MSLKESIISVFSEFNHMDSEVLENSTSICSRECLIRAVELLFKNGEIDTERAKTIRNYL